MTVIVII